MRNHSGTEKLHSGHGDLSYRIETAVNFVVFVASAVVKCKTHILSCRANSKMELLNHFHHRPE